MRVALRCPVRRLQGFEVTVEVVVTGPFIKKFPCNHIINIKRKIFFREAKDSVNFSFFILLHKSAKPIHPPYIHLSAHLSTHTSTPSLCDAVGGAFITLGANATTCRRQAIYLLASIHPS